VRRTKSVGKMVCTRVRRTKSAGKMVCTCVRRTKLAGFMKIGASKSDGVPEMLLII
jgi:hypothetical protein